MVLSISETWKAEIERSGSTPIYLVDMYLGPTAFLSVLDYLSGVGQSFTVSLTAESLPNASTTFTQGVDFTLDNGTGTPSNNNTAASMVIALNTSTMFLSYGVLAYAAGPLVVILPNGTGPQPITSLIMSAPAGAAAWVARPNPCPRIVSFVSGSMPMPWGVDGSGTPNGTMCPAAIDTINPFAYQVDVVTRAPTVGDCEIVFPDDGELRDFFSRCRPRGKVVKVYLGADTMDASTVREGKLGVFTIEEYLPSWGECTIRLTDAFEILKTKQIAGNFVWNHPLSVIKRALIVGGMPPSFYDATTLDYTAAQYSDISHFVIQRHNYWGATVRSGALSTHPYLSFDPKPELPTPLGGGSALGAWDGTVDASPAGIKQNAIQDPVDARSIVNDMSMLLNGTLCPFEDGIAKFIRYDSTKPVVRHFGADEIAYFEPVKIIDDLFNRWDFAGMTQAHIAGGKPIPLFSKKDDLSALANGDLTVKRDFSQKLQSDWIGMPGFTIVGNILSGMSSFSGPGTSGTTIEVFAPNGCFSGTKQNEDGYTGVPTQASYDTITSGRPAWLVIVDTGTGQYEIVKATAMVFDPSTGDGSVLFEVPPGVDSGGPSSIYWDVGFPTPGRSYVSTWPILSFTVVRGQNGTAAIDITNPSGGEPTRNLVFDATIAEYACRVRLDRFANGCPQIRIRVPLIHADLQVTDFVTIDEPAYFAFNRQSGADVSGPVFEIISKTVDAHAATVEFLLAWVRDDGTTGDKTPSTSPSYPPMVFPGGGTGSTESYMVDNEGEFVLTNGGDYIFPR